MPFKLSGLMLNRVDLCPDGSNPDAHIVLFKSKEGRMPAKKKVPARKAKAPQKPATKSKKKLEDDDEEEEEEDDDRVIEKDADDDEDEDDADAEEEEEEEEDDEPVVKKGGRRKEDQDDDEDEDKSKKRKKGPKSKKSVKKAVADEDDEDEDDEDEDADDDLDVETVDEEVLKTLPKHVQSIVAKQNARLRRVMKTAREAAEMATVEKDRRESLEFVEKAKKDVPSLPGTPEEKGDLLKAIFSGKPLETKVAKAIVKLLKAGDAAVKSLLMSETGSRRARTEEEEDAVSALREKQDEIMKADKKLTKEQAFEKACQDNPDLFIQYKVEKKRAQRAEN